MYKRGNQDRDLMLLAPGGMADEEQYLLGNPLPFFKYGLIPHLKEPALTTVLHLSSGTTISLISSLPFLCSTIYLFLCNCWCLSLPQEHVSSTGQGSLSDVSQSPKQVPGT